ncbi:MAG: ribosome-associated translation inhibitor RaiA [Candidatus Kerfeldbacteria bacterium]|nr:ribosome-associated translation inhibitor RaiA [Candidatus Kerfeldbacteria bacterium]
MPTTITARHFELTEAIKNYIEEKTAHLHKQYDNILSIEVEVERITNHKQGDVYQVRMNLSVPQHMLHAEELRDDLYAAVDVCRDELTNQLRKYKDKFESKKRKARKTRRDLKSIFPFWNREE